MGSVRRRRAVKNLAAVAHDWYRELASFLGEQYLTLPFVQGTVQEVDFLESALSLGQGMRLLDVGCGTGRHALEFSRRGYRVVGVDISTEFLGIARASAASESLSTSFFESDAHNLPFDTEFDAAYSLCEGAFGLGMDDFAILSAIVRSVDGGCIVCVGAPHLSFVLQHLEGGFYDPQSMVYRTRRRVVNASGATREFDMYNSCFTPKELLCLAKEAGLAAEAVYGVAPGSYHAQECTTGHPELLLLARRPVPG